MDVDSNLYLYKFLKFDESSKKVVTDGTIKFSSYREFNDPFDCLPSFDSSNLDEALRAGSPFSKRLGEKHSLSPSKRITLAGKLKAGFKKAIESGSFAESLAGLGIFCLSGSPLNILMWSHYAAHHQGFLVEFRFDQEETPDPEFEPLYVTYSKHRPQTPFETELTREYATIQFKDQYLTKSKDWEYEKEYRVLVRGRSPGVYPYDRSKFLCSIVGGARMKNFSELAAIVEELNAGKELDIKCYQAKLCDKTYAIYVPGHPRLDR